MLLLGLNTLVQEFKSIIASDVLDLKIRNQLAKNLGEQDGIDKEFDKIDTYAIINGHNTMLDNIEEKFNKNTLYGVSERVFEDGKPLILSAVQNLSDKSDIIEFRKEYIYTLRYNGINDPETKAKDNFILVYIFINKLNEYEHLSNENNWRKILKNEFNIDINTSLSNYMNLIGYGPKGA